MKKFPIRSRVIENQYCSTGLFASLGSPLNPGSSYYTSVRFMIVPASRGTIRSSHNFRRRLR